MKWFCFWMVDGILQVLFEILEGEPCRIDRPTQKSLLRQRFQLDQPEPGHRIDPATPDIAIPLRLELSVAITQKGPRRLARQVAMPRHHRDRLAHLGADELVGFGIPND